MTLTKTLGIEKPIIQAPMAGVQNWELAVAVSNAGGLGSIPCGMLSEQQILSEITHFKRHSNKPYNLNFFCHSMPPVNLRAMKRWQDVLQHYYEEFSLGPPTELGTLRLPFDDSIADKLEPHKPPIISFHFGLPAPKLIARIKSWGTIVISSATTESEGLWLQEHGADVVIAQGIEAGGHRAMFLTTDASTQRPTAELVQRLTPVLSLPVIAAGGIANASQVSEMMALGASGVQIGTAYLLCDEAKTTSIHRDEIRKKSNETALTNIYSGRLARGITTRVMNDLDFVSDTAPEFPYASIALAPLRAKAEGLNRSDFSPLWAGTNRAGCKAISAQLLTNEIWPSGK